MKKLLLTSALIALVITSYSQAPNAFNYQAILRNSDGTIKPNEAVALQISIVDETGGSVYLEIHNTTTNNLGLVNVVIGQGTTSDDLSTVDWANGPYFIDITVNGVNMGSSPLLSVPYALYAASGNEGPQGLQGEIGPKGDVGSQGEQGLPGLQGEPGDTKWDEITGGISYVNGNVGIGTTEPITKLQVHGLPTSQYGQLVISSPPGIDAELSFYENNEYKALFWWDAGSSALRLQNYENGDITLNSYAGNVGIGTIEPTEKLDVDGNLHVSGNIIVDGEVKTEGISELATKTYIDTFLKQLNDKGIIAIDIDGNIYSTARIGNQIWMAENLRVTRYADGTEITQITSIPDWQAVTDNDKAYSCFSFHDFYCNSSYGLYYTWAAAMNGTENSSGPFPVQGVCPDGWHLPHDEEWKTLERYIGMDPIEVNAEGGYRGMDVVHKLWGVNDDPSNGEINETGFTAIFAGCLGGLTHDGDGSEGVFWTSTNAMIREINYSDIIRVSRGSKAGLSVRCVKD